MKGEKNKIKFIYIDWITVLLINVEIKYLTRKFTQRKTHDFLKQCQKLKPKFKSSNIRCIVQKFWKVHNAYIITYIQQNKL